MITAGKVKPEDLPNDACMASVVPRHGQYTKPVCVPLTGLGLRSGAIAHSVAHDCHNILDDAVEIQALVESLDGVLKSFYFYDPRISHPKADPDGSLLGAAAPTISAVATSNKAMRIAGLPAGYTLTRGDILAFDYADPARRALHRIDETVSADGTGETPTFEVRPHFRTGVETGLAVMLIKPAARMIMEPARY